MLSLVSLRPYFIKQNLEIPNTNALWRGPSLVDKCRTKIETNWIKQSEETASKRKVEKSEMVSLESHDGPEHPENVFFL